MSEHGGRVFFARSRRAPDRDSEIRLLSIGVDIGSATSHLALSRLVLQRRGSQSKVIRRELLHHSDILLTPYGDDATIDTPALARFIADQYRAAEISPEMIDTGALILTGLAARTHNAHAIGALFAAEAGQLVAVAAGDALETTLAAHGSGAVAASAGSAARVMAIDIGGGTSKIALCAGGAVIDLTALDIGARLVCFDADGRVTRIEPAAADCGLRVGEIASGPQISAIAEKMADQLLQACGAAAITPATAQLLRLPALQAHETPDRVILSGGVAEYAALRETRSFGDLGAALARAVLTRLRAWGPVMDIAASGLRATVIGASQYAVQLSGHTIFIHPASVLPLRNLPVISPQIDWTAELTSDAIAQAVKAALHRLGLADAAAPVAVAYRWQGVASHARLQAFARGVAQGVAVSLQQACPLVLVGERDVGGLLGLQCREAGLADAVISIDGITAAELDFIDIGALLQISGGVPVVVKSLVFPPTAQPSRNDESN